jgi:7,8-dihydro-6-hydroxymethylpterin-pyrophosphokinase
MSGMLMSNILRLPLAAAADGKLASATHAQQARKRTIDLDIMLVVQLVSKRGYNSWRSL